jgi:hypothetical protein
MCTPKLGSEIMFNEPLTRNFYKGKVVEISDTHVTVEYRVTNYCTYDCLMTIKLNRQIYFSN